MEDHLRLHSHFPRQRLQTGSILVPVATKDVRVGRTRHQVNHMFVLRQDLRHCLNYVFNAFIRRQQAERQQHCFSFDTESVFVEIWIEKGQVRNPVRNHVNLAARHFVDLLQELRRELAHDDEAIRKLRNLFHDPELVRIGLAQNCVQCCHHRHLQTAQQMQDMTARGTAEDSVLVLQAHHVDILEVQELSGFLIRSNVVLGERPSHPRGIVVPLFRVVDRQCEQSSGPKLGRDGLTQVRGESSDSTVSRKVIPDHRDSTRQRWLRLRSWASL